MLGRYNLTAANRKSRTDGEVFEFGGEFYGTMTAMMGAGIAVEISWAIVSDLSAQAQMRFGYDARMNVQTSLDAQTAVRMDVIKKGDYTSNLEANMQRVLNEPIRMSGEMDAVLGLEPDIIPHGELFGDVTALWNSLQIKETVMRFEEITIPPNGTVVIDSEYFTAVMNSENIVDLYDGDWLMISEKLMAMEARGISSGDLNVKVLYREMYL